MSNLNTEQIESISPDKIEVYLRDKGWNEDRKVERVASLWSFERTKNNKRFSVILPLDKSFGDFNLKIEELINILAEVEGKNRETILKNLESISTVAKKENKEIIDLKIKTSSSNRNEAPAKPIGEVLKSLQNFFTCMENLIHDLKDNTQENKSENARKTKKRRSGGKPELKVSLIDTFHGSFALRLGLTAYTQLDLFEQLPSEKAAERFMSLVEASSQGSNYLIEEMRSIQGELSLKFRSLINSLIKLDSDLILEWGSVNPEKGSITRLPLSKIIEAYETVKRIQMEDPYTYEVTGKLIVCGIGDKKESRIFLLIDVSNRKEYKGHVSKELLKNLSGNIELDKFYRATIEETLVNNPATGEEFNRYMLTKLNDLETNTS